MAQYDYFAANKATKYGEKLANKWFQRLADDISQLQVKEILEIGPGQGQLARALQNSPDTYNYQCVEPNQRLAEELTKQGILTHCQYVPPIPLEDSSVDLVILNHVIEHLGPLSQLSDILNEIYRVLKPGGELMIMAPDIMDFQGLFFDADYTHNYPIGWKNCIDLMSDFQLHLTQGQYTYGSLNFWPGYFLNILTSIALKVMSPLENAFPMKTNKVRKLRTLFSRCLYLRFKK